MFSNKIGIFGSGTMRPTDEDQTVRKRCGAQILLKFYFFIIRFLAQFRDNVCRFLFLIKKQNLKFLFCLCTLKILRLVYFE